MIYLVETIYPNDDPGTINEHESYEAALADFNQIIADVDPDDGYDYVVIGKHTSDYDFIETMNVHTFTKA